jgi:hypothetical protein
MLVSPYNITLGRASQTTRPNGQEIVGDNTSRTLIRSRDDGHDGTTLSIDDLDGTDNLRVRLKRDEHGDASLIVRNPGQTYRRSSAVEIPLGNLSLADAHWFNGLASMAKQVFRVEVHQPNGGPTTIHIFGDQGKSTLIERLEVGGASVRKLESWEDVDSAPPSTRGGPTGSIEDTIDTLRQAMRTHDVKLFKRCFSRSGESRLLAVDSVPAARAMEQLDARGLDGQSLHAFGPTNAVTANPGFGTEIYFELTPRGWQIDSIDQKS